jgi:hypothetical protein
MLLLSPVTDLLVDDSIRTLTEDESAKRCEVRADIEDLRIGQQSRVRLIPL